MWSWNEIQQYLPLTTLSIHYHSGCAAQSYTKEGAPLKMEAKNPLSSLVLIFGSSKWPEEVSDFIYSSVAFSRGFNMYVIHAK